MSLDVERIILFWLLIELNVDRTVVNGNWGQWSAWAKFDKSIESGRNHRFRYPSKYIHIHPIQFQNCNECFGQELPTSHYHNHYNNKEIDTKTQYKKQKCNDQYCPVNCHWGAWKIGRCNKECGGGRRTNYRQRIFRQRTVREAHEGTNGTMGVHGKVDSKQRTVREAVNCKSCQGGCYGQRTTTETCNTQKCSEDCHWSAWNIGDCTKTCGGGRRVKSRRKIGGDLNDGICYGSGITDEYVQNTIEDCNTMKCPVAPVNCHWGAWKIGSCSVTCGGGNRRKSRRKIVVEAHGGICYGARTLIESCNTQKCPANCQWGAWSIGDCSKSCGGGTRAKYRRKVEHEANGGTCHGVWDIEEDCNTQKCPVECQLSDWTIGECSTKESILCKTGKRTDIRRIETPDENGGTCNSSVIVRVEDCLPISCTGIGWVVAGSAIALILLALICCPLCFLWYKNRKEKGNCKGDAEDKVIYHQECKETTEYDIFVPAYQNSHSEYLVSEGADVIRNHPIRIIDRPYCEANVETENTSNQEENHRVRFCGINVWNKDHQRSMGMHSTPESPNYVEDD